MLSTFPSTSPFDFEIRSKYRKKSGSNNQEILYPSPHSHPHAFLNNRPKFRGHTNIYNKSSSLLPFSSRKPHLPHQHFLNFSDPYQTLPHFLAYRPIILPWTKTGKELANERTGESYRGGMIHLQPYLIETLDGRWEHFLGLKLRYLRSSSSEHFRQRDLADSCLESHSSDKQKRNSPHPPCIHAFRYLRGRVSPFQWHTASPAATGLARHGKF